MAIYFFKDFIYLFEGESEQGKKQKAKDEPIVEAKKNKAVPILSLALTSPSPPEN